VRLHVVVALVLLLDTGSGWLHTAVGAEGCLYGEEFEAFLPLSFGAFTVVCSVSAHRCAMVEQDY